MNSNSVTVSPTPGNLLDEFEEAYQNCLGSLTREDPLTCVDHAELRTNADANTAHFIEMGRAMQAFFLQKRFQLAAQKPELVMMEDVLELRGELARKDELIKKQSEKLAEWQSSIAALQTKPPGVSSICSTTSNSNNMSSTINGGNNSNGSNGSLNGVTHSSMATMNSSSSNAPMSVGRGGGAASMQSVNTTQQQQQSNGIMQSPQQQQSMGGHTMPSAMTSNQQSNHGGGGGGMDAAGRGGVPHMSPNVNGSPHMAAMSSISNNTNSMMTTAQQQGVTGYSGPEGNSPLMMGGYSPVLRGQGTAGGLQGPLAYLEKTTTNIGMP